MESDTLQSICEGPAIAMVVCDWAANLDRYVGATGDQAPVLELNVRFKTFLDRDLPRTHVGCSVGRAFSSTTYAPWLCPYFGALFAGE